MDNKITEARRALFAESMRKKLEAEWYDPYSIDSLMEVGSSGEYSSIRIRGAWEGFNAALDAVEIAFPLRTHNAWHDYDQGYNACLEDCRSAIESTNLGLRVK